MDDLSSITAAVKEEIKERKTLPESSFNLWFGDFNLISLTEDKAVFSTPYNLRRKILSTKHIDVISSSLEYIIGFAVEIEIISLEEGSSEYSSIIKRENTVPQPFDKETSEESERQEREVEEFLNSNLETPKKTLLEDYTFENFVEGSSNKFAKAACEAVAKDPCYYNPLFIYGHSGLGKTHLLYAVMNYMKKNNPDLKIVYKKTESFVNELIDAIKENNTAPFKEKYRKADVLLIDDIQFIAKKDATQDEFFHTFSALYEAEKQIILTSDRPPNEIEPLTDRLRTRFEGGLIADVQPPSFELRTAIIKKKSENMGLTIPPDLINYMAERLNNNIRQIEGVLKKLGAFVKISNIPITKESIDKIISIVDPGNVPTDILVERIISVVSKHHGIPPEDIKSKRKTDSIAKARHVSIYLIKKLTELSLKEIGKIFGRDHSTVSSSINNVNLSIKTKNNFESDINKMIEEIKAK